MINHGIIVPVSRPIQDDIGFKSILILDLKGRNERATLEYEEKLYLKALEEYKVEQAALEKAQSLNPELFKNAETA